MTVLAFPDTTGQPTDGSFQYTANGVIYSWNGVYWAANNQQGFDQRYVEVAGDVMTGDLTVPSLNGGPLAGLRNQLINSDFRIRQRNGPSAGSASQEYNIDRWTLGSSAAWSGGPDNDRPAGQPFVRSLRVGNPGAQTSLKQAIELPATGNAGQFQVGTTWTISFWANDAVTLPAFVFADNAEGTNFVDAATPPAPTPTGETGGGTWVRYSSTFSITGTPAGTSTCFSVHLSAQGARITGIQLEPGPQYSPWEHRPIGLEMQLCQRYFWSVERIRGMMRWHGYDNSTYADPILVPFPVEMRAYPTRSDITGTATDDSGGALSNFAWGSNNGGKDKIYIHVAKTDGTQPPAGYHTRVEGATFTLDAEL